MILNLTQHPATAEQLDAGVVDLEPAMRAELQRLLTFASLPTARQVDERAQAIAALVEPLEAKRAMIGGAPFLMARLEAALQDYCIEPVYAFSVRESVEQTQADGSVRKVNVFRHAGWVPA